MKISVVAIVLAAVTGISAAPVPNGPVAALEARASDAISSFMGFFRREDSIFAERRDTSPLPGLRKKVAVRTVGRTVSLPR